MSIIGTLMLTAACAGVLSVYSYTTDQQIKEAIRQTNREQIIFDEKIRQAHKAAVEKEALRQAAARTIAARSASGDSATEDIDSRQCAATNTHIDPLAMDVVVNKKHCIQPLSYQPSDLITTHGVTLRAEASNAFLRLSTAAQEAGQSFFVTSSYRSYADQVATYRYWVATSGQEVADTYSARPGYSEHQTGLVVDVATPGCMLDCFGATTQYQWLQENAATYGFIQRYQKNSELITGYKAEEWHFRYVGTKTAQRMKAQNITTLEELFAIPGGSY